jgi:biopolymer transport protein ExbD
MSSAEVPAPTVHESVSEEIYSSFSRHGKKRRKKKAIHLPGEEITELNLTAMMDIMTILIIFLLKNFANEPQKLNMDDHLRPPESSAKTPMVPAVTITITTESILVDDKVVVLTPDVKLGSAKQMLIQPLSDSLNAKTENLKALAQRTGQPFTGNLLIIAHREIPYSLLSAVLYTAGQADYSKYKLVTMGKAKQ